MCPIRLTKRGDAMVDLGPFKEAMQSKFIYIILLGIALIIGNLFFRKLGKKTRKKNR